MAAEDGKKRVAYLTDVEGNLDYFHNYVAISKVLKWTDDKTKTALDFKSKEDMFVFGGDSQDKGIGDVRFVRLLLAFKEKYPDRVHWIIGNRDCNKLRLAAELADEAIEDKEVQADKEFPYWVKEKDRVTPNDFLKEVLNEEAACTAADQAAKKAKEEADKAAEEANKVKEANKAKEADTADKAAKDAKEEADKAAKAAERARDLLTKVGQTHTKANRLRWMLKHTMDADGAFERRQMELGILNKKDNDKVTDDDVVNSFVNEVNPDSKIPEDEKFMLRYLEHGELARIFGKTLFVHGALNQSNFGTVPGKKDKEQDVNAWVKQLNEWKTAQVDDFKTKPCEGKNRKERAGHKLMDYGVQGGNEGKTVICATYLDDGNAARMHEDVVEHLAKGKISTVVVGHIPHGDCPTVIRTQCKDKGAVTVVMADTSKSKMGHPSELGVDNRGKAVSEVLIYQDGEVSVHGVLADGSEIEYDVPVKPDWSEDAVNVGEQLMDRSWVKAKFKGKDEYLVCKGKGFSLDTRKHTKGEVSIEILRRFPFMLDMDSGTVEWESRRDEEPRRFLRVRVGDGQSSQNPDGKESKVHPKILRFVLEHAWGLTQPNVLLTVTGGAQDFDLDADDKDELLQGLTDTAKSVGAWFTTGGTSAGIMKYMGLARLLYANEIPLIGIASFGIVKGRESFRHRSYKDQGSFTWKGTESDTPVQYEAACKASKNSVELDVNHSHFQNSVELDVNHSHFLFAENKHGGVFGQEFHLRSQLESAICDAHPHSAVIFDEWKEEWTKYGVKKPETASVTRAIPAVCVCVQGGPGTIETVCSSVDLGTPVLLVKGSGKAADLIADVHLVNKGLYKGDKDHHKLLKDALDHLDNEELLTMGDEKKVKDLRQKAKEYFEAHEDECAKIFEFYHMPEKNKDKVAPIVALVKAKPQGFAVYDLEGRRGDLKGALLRCILAWQDHLLAAKALERVRSKTLLAVQWDKSEILGEMLLKERKSDEFNKSIKKYLQVIGDGLLEALCTGNEKCVEMLIDHGADITEFGVERKHLRGEVESADEKARKASKVERTRQAVQWKILMECADEKTQHVKQMLDEVEDERNEKSGEGHGQTILKKKRGAGALRYSYKELNEKAEATAKVNWKDALHNKDFEDCKEGELDELFFGAIGSFSHTDELYRSLMGPDWSYTAGSLGKTWDLFLCMVVMNRHKIAKICWEKLDLPVRSALVACKLYREMAKKPFVRREVSLEMEENANDFEKMATEVMQLAMEENMVLAIESLETRAAFLGGNTTYDLAIQCEARSFVTICCKDATDRRFFADMKAEKPKWMPDWLPVPGWMLIFLCLCTGGFAAPHFLDYRLPPEAEGCRPPSLTRKIPVGYPDKPTENPKLKEKIQSQKNKIDLQKETKTQNKLTLWQKLYLDEKAIRNFSEEQLAEVWLEDFSYAERWWCFVAAPIVHFQLRALIYTSLVLWFTASVTNVHLKWSQEGDMEEISKLDDRMWWVWVYMFGSFFIEARQLWMSGMIEYIGDSWNFIDLTTLSSFFIGHYLGFVYRVLTPIVLTLFHVSSESVLQWPDPANPATYYTELLDDRKKMYCVCLFFCWLRLLHLYSVHKTLGTLVRAIMTMVPDITTFIFVWGFFLMAFAAAMFAGETAHQTCAAGETCKTQQDDVPAGSVKNWKYWWILRTYFQAYGDMDVGDLTDWVTCAIFMILLLVLQLVLNNTVFVAVLTTKFEDVVQESQTDWMFEMYDISEEFMQHPWPSPFNLPWMLWEAVQFMLDEAKVQKLIRQEHLACLQDEDDGTRTHRWWHFHTRLRHPRYADAVLLPREVVSELEMEGDKPTLTSQESKEESTEDTQDSTDFDFHSLVICAVPVLGVLVLNAVPSPWRHFAIYAIFVFTAAKADKVGKFVSFVWEKLSTVGAGSKRPAQYLLIAYQNAVHLVLWLEPAVLELLEQIKSLTGCTSEKNARTAGAGAENGTGEPGATATRKETAATSETSKEAATPETSRQKARRFSMIMIEHTISVEKVEKRKETTLKDGEVSRRDRALVMRAKARYMEKIKKEGDMSNEEVYQKMKMLTDALEAKMKNQEEGGTSIEPTLNKEARERMVAMEAKDEGSTSIKQPIGQTNWDADKLLATRTPRQEAAGMSIEQLYEKIREHTDTGTKELHDKMCKLEKNMEAKEVGGMSVVQPSQQLRELKDDGGMSIKLLYDKISALETHMKAHTAELEKKFKILEADIEKAAKKEEENILAGFASFFDGMGAKQEKR